MSALSTHDLRSNAKPYLREKTHNAKWARGAKEAAGQKCSEHETFNNSCQECLTRPNRRDFDRRLGRAGARARHNEQNKLSGQAATLARKAFRNEVVAAMDFPIANTSDVSSEEEEVAEASAAPLPAEAFMMYNFDPRGSPTAGQHVLSLAVTQAVERFESKETDKLIRKEYDMVEGKADVDAYAADIDASDYELVEHPHLN